MRIFETDYLRIKDELFQLHRKGDYYIAYLSDGITLSCKEITSFSTGYDAAEYCHEMSTNVDIMYYDAIWPLCLAMEKGLEDKSLLETNNGIVDLSALLRAYYQIDKQGLLNNQNNKVMNHKNLEYLQDQVKFTGFGEALGNDIKNAIEKGNAEFKLNHEANYGNDTVKAELNFSQSKQSDMYFFNSYKVALEKEGTPEKLEQTFYINKGNNITLKEAYNLLEGRSVNKDLTNREGQVYNVWLQMDFKQAEDNGNFKLKHYHENYGYDLEAALSKHPIKELGNDEYKSNLIDSLKKGNLQSATFQKDGTETKQFIEASPQYKTVHIYDEAMQRLDSRQSKTEKKAEEVGQSEKQDGKKEKQAKTDEDGTDVQKPASRKRTKQSM